MNSNDTVWLANSHGVVLGNTNLYVDEMLGQDEEDFNSPETNVFMFVNAFLIKIGCEDKITKEEAREMIDSSTINDGKHVVTLPKRFSCPKHGFASSSV